MINILSPRTLLGKNFIRVDPIPVIGEAVPCDVVIPFWSGDSHWVPESVMGIAGQLHSEPVIHVIADGCDFPDDVMRLRLIIPRLFLYRHERNPGQGPYRLTNSLVRHGHCKTAYLALQDADDVSLPDRLWRQISLLQLTGSKMISSAMQQFVDAEADEQALSRLRNEPVLKPGRVYATVPRGRCVNSMRTMTIDLFRFMNGFQNFKCTGDFEFDNRVRFGDSGSKVIDDQTILGRRRIHASSLSHGIAPMKSPMRNRDINMLMKSLELVRGCSSCAPNLGTMRAAFKLEVVT